MLYLCIYKILMYVKAMVTREISLTIDQLCEIQMRRLYFQLITVLNGREKYISPLHNPSAERDKSRDLMIKVTILQVTRLDNFQVNVIDRRAEIPPPPKSELPFKSPLLISLLGVTGPIN
jgi:hypothetical protein